MRNYVLKFRRARYHLDRLNGEVGAWFKKSGTRTTKYAPAIARLTRLYGVPWFAEPVRVDVVRVGKSQGAYTSNHPTHIVVASADLGYAEWSSVEMLFHESCTG